MGKTHCFYINTTVKPNIRVNRRGAVLPQATGRFTPGMGQNGFNGVYLKLVITYVWLINHSETCDIHKVYIPQHYYCTIMHIHVTNTKIYNFSLRGAGLPQVTLLHSVYLHAAVYYSIFQEQESYRPKYNNAVLMRIRLLRWSM